MKSTNNLVMLNDICFWLQIKSSSCGRGQHLHRAMGDFNNKRFADAEDMTFTKNRYECLVAKDKNEYTCSSNTHIEKKTRVMNNIRKPYPGKLTTLIIKFFSSCQ